MTNQQDNMQGEFEAMLRRAMRVTPPADLAGRIETACRLAGSMTPAVPRDLSERIFAATHPHRSRLLLRPAWAFAAAAAVLLGVTVGLIVLPSSDRFGRNSQGDVLASVTQLIEDLERGRPAQSELETRVATLAVDLEEVAMNLEQSPAEVVEDSADILFTEMQLMEAEFDVF